jgi:hypothetical protein
MTRPIVILRSLDRSALPTHRRPWDRLAYGVVVGFLLGAVLFGLGVIRAEDGDDAPRFAPSSRGTRPAVSRWRPLLEQYPDWDVDTGLRVIDCESGGDPAVWNYQGSGAVGLWQLLGWEWLARRLFGSALMTDPWVNTAVAHVIWLESGGRFGTSMGWAASAGCWSS